MDRVSGDQNLTCLLQAREPFPLLGNVVIRRGGWDSEGHRLLGCEVLYRYAHTGAVLASGICGPKEVCEMGHQSC